MPKPAEWSKVMAGLRKLHASDLVVRVGILGAAAAEVPDPVLPDATGFNVLRKGQRRRKERLTQPKGTLNQASIAAVHEYGSPAAGIPKRSFLRNAFIGEGAKELRTQQIKIAKLLFRGRRDLTDLLKLLGLWAESRVRRYVAKGLSPANSAATLRRKKDKTRRGSKRSPKPLIDTGRLLASISSDVVRGKSD